MGRVGLGSLRLLSPMHGRYYGEKTRAGCWEKRRGQAVLGKRRRLYVLRKTRAVCSSMGGLQGGDDEAAESGAEMVVRLGGIGVVGVGLLELGLGLGSEGSGHGGGNACGSPHNAFPTRHAGRGLSEWLRLV